MPTSRRTTITSQTISLIAALLVLLSSLVSVHSILALNSGIQQAAHSRKVVVDIAALLIFVQAAESSSHDYVLTGNENELTDYRAALPGIVAINRDLDALLVNDVAQRQRLNTIRPQIANHLSELATEVSTNQSDQHAAAVAMVAADRDSGDIDTIFKGLVGMYQADVGEMDRFHSAIEQERIKSIVLVIFSAAFTTILLTAHVLTISRYIRRQSRSLAALRQSEQRQYQAQEELARSNTELEQFAYIASHDLQEPLRTIAGYVQLLQRRYQGKLDDDADLFIRYAVEAAARMRNLITDLLAYSRVGRAETVNTAVDTNVLMETVIAQLQGSLTESGGKITYAALPRVWGNEDQLGMLFQNLLSNALKFHRDEPPIAHVSATKEGGFWRFAVQDNGIGIAPEYQEQIFVIFKRLHSNKAYEGTGIGLAVCKKIVERHGGCIWLESVPGQGTTFYFTLQELDDETRQRKTND
jgi:signal transduction histidine kinase